MSDKLIVERLQDLRICDIGLRRVAANRIKQLAEERGLLREAALREALAAVNAKWRSGADTPDEMRGLALAEAAILDLIDKLGHVNETPKSEHDAANVLTPAKGDTHD